MRWSTRNPGLAVLRQRPALALLTFAAFLSYACGGCISNEYVIHRAELARIAQLPPEARGQRVLLVQELGDRRGEAIDPQSPPPLSAPPPGAYADGSYGPPSPGYIEASPGVDVGVGILIVPGPGPSGPRRGFAGTPPPRPGAAGPPPIAPGRATGVPPAAGATRPAPVSSKNPGRLGSGGGSGKASDTVVLLVVAAVGAALGMAATEGLRFDGEAGMNPWQLVYLRDAAGTERGVPLAQISPLDASIASKAVVKDDEGWGITRMQRRPLDRHGFAFKLGLGAMTSMCSCSAVDGMAWNIQLGYFPHHRFGLLANWSPTFGTDSAGQSFYRHDLSLEAQAFPIQLWRLHLGGFGHGGLFYATGVDGGGRQEPAFGAGLVLELALTTRLALTVRADYTTARIGGGGQDWLGSGALTGGVAIY